jgi:hypothetical protein
MIYEKIENIKRPIKLGEKFSVACLVKRNTDNEIICLYPVINHPHNDTENGQIETHYHVDYRFLLTEEAENGQGFDVIDERLGHKCADETARLEEGINGKLEYHILQVISEKHRALTQQFFIRNSNLKHKCIVKGKCPHRGFNLSQEKAVDGKITCPLHGLVFDEKTGEIDKELLTQLASYHNTEMQYKEDMKKLLSKFNKVKYGDTITQEQYNEFNKFPLTCIFSTIQYAPKNGYIYYEWRQDKTSDYRPKPLDDKDKKKLKFRVKT